MKILWASIEQRSEAHTDQLFRLENSIRVFNFRIKNYTSKEDIKRMMAQAHCKEIVMDCDQLDLMKELIADEVFPLIFVMLSEGLVLKRVRLHGENCKLFEP